MRRFGDNFTNPPAWYQSTDPSQIPVQTWPMPGGYGPYNPYGPWPGYYFGVRTMTAADAERAARERQEFMERRAEVTDVPEHKYINPEGTLSQPVAAAFRAAAAEAQRKKEEGPLAEIKKKLLASALVGSVLKTILE